MTIRTALRLGRVSNLPTVWTNVAAGIILAGGSLELRSFAMLAFSLSLFYVGGMYLNDAFDRAVDAVERPERPIPSGDASAAAVFAIGFGLLAVGELIVAQFGLRPALAGAALAATIIYYDAYHKTNPLSPLVMGACRVLVYATAALAVAPTPRAAVYGGAAVLLAYLIGLTYAAKQENLREIRNLWPLALIAAPLVYTAPHVLQGDVVPALLYGAFIGWAWFAVRCISRKQIGEGVVVLIAGISLLDALLIATQAEPALAVICGAAALLTRALQRIVPGT